MNINKTAAFAILAATVVAIAPLARPLPPAPAKPMVTVVDAAGAAVPGAYLDNGVRVLQGGNIFRLDWQNGQAIALMDITQVDDRVQIADSSNLYYKDPACTQPITAWLDRYETLDDNLPVGAMVSIGFPTNEETGERAPLHRFSGPLDYVYRRHPLDPPAACSEAGVWLGLGRYMILEAWSGDVPSAPGPLRVELR